MMEVGRGDKLRCRHRTLGMGIVAAMLNPLTTVMYFGRRLGHQCHADRGTCVEILVLPGIDTPDHLSQPSNIGIMVPDTLHSPIICEHQQIMVRLFAQTLHNHITQHQAILQTRGWKLVKTHGISCSETKTTRLSLRATNAHFGGIGRIKCSSQTAWLFVLERVAFDVLKSWVWSDVVSSTI
jgi:hypothetical protein